MEADLTEMTNEILKQNPHFDEINEIIISDHENEMCSQFVYFGEVTANNGFKASYLYDNIKDEWIFNAN